MTVWMALLLPLLTAQDPADDLRKELLQLKKQNLELQERLSLLEQSAVEDAQTIQRLRQVVKLLEAGTPADPAGSPKAPGAPAVKPDQGAPRPVQSLKGKVVYVDAKNNFIALSLGKKDKVEIGYRFEIFRETFQNGGDSNLTKLGSGEVEKFMGQDSMAKVVISEGNIGEMKADDLAVAIRRIEPLAPSKEKEEPKAQLPASPEAIREGIFKITGRAGTGPSAGFVINFGSAQGAHQTQLLWVYADGKFKAKLRIDRVAKDHSIAFVIDNTMELSPDTGDQVYLKELNKSLTGKVALSDEKRGVLAIDLRQRDGVKVGNRCEVRRLGQKIGTISITEVQNWGSWARPEGDLKIDQIMKGDFVELIDEK